MCATVKATNTRKLVVKGRLKERRSTRLTALHCFTVYCWHVRKYVARIDARFPAEQLCARRDLRGTGGKAEAAKCCFGLVPWSTEIWSVACNAAVYEDRHVSDTRFSTEGVLHATSHKLLRTPCRSNTPQRSWNSVRGRSTQRRYTWSDFSMYRFSWKSATVNM